MATTNYSLHQWEKEERPDRAELNQNFETIDTALGQKVDEDDVVAELTTMQSSINTRFSSVNSLIGTLEDRVEVTMGQYVGTGAATRAVNLGFYPRAVLVEAQHGMRDGGYGGLSFRGAACKNGDYLIEVTSTGFSVHTSGANIQTNNKDLLYLYLAFQ